MTIRHRIITVGTTPTLLNPELDDNNATRGFNASYQNSDASITVFLGASNVSPGSFGKALIAGAEVNVGLEPGEQLYGVTAGGNVLIYALYQGA